MIDNLLFFAGCAAFVGFFLGLLWLARREAREKQGVPASEAPAGPRPQAAPGAEGGSYREPSPRAVPSTNGAQLRLEIVRLDDGPSALEQQLPFVCTHVRRIPGSDRPDYDLFAVETPIVWNGRRVDRVVIAPRLVGARLGWNMRELLVGLAFAKDGRLADATELDFAQAEYVAVAYATSIDP